jgi:Arc/MetJ-type ribon-helix-helix transcriptional regulator
MSEKISFSIAEESSAALEVLRKHLRVDSAADVIRQALTLLSLATKTTREHGEVLLRATDGTETAVQIGLPLNKIDLPITEYARGSHSERVVALLRMVPSNRGYEGFTTYISDGDTDTSCLSPLRYCEMLRIDLETLANLAHVHRDTLIQMPASKHAQRYMRQALQVLRAAFDLFGDIHKATFWYRNEPLSPFEYKTAEQLVSEDRTNDVVSYVESLHAGASG